MLDSPLITLYISDRC